MVLPNSEKVSLSGCRITSRLALAILLIETASSCFYQSLLLSSPWSQELFLWHWLLDSLSLNFSTEGRLSLDGVLFWAILAENDPRGSSQLVHGRQFFHNCLTHFVPIRAHQRQCCSFIVFMSLGPEKTILFGSISTFWAIIAWSRSMKAFSSLL